MASYESLENYNERHRMRDLMYDKMLRVGIAILGGVIAIFLVIQVWGCAPSASYRRANQKTINDTIKMDKYAHKIGIASIENKSFFKKENIEKSIQWNLLQTIRQNCPKLVIVTSEEEEAPEFLKALPKSPDDRIDNIVLADESGKRGFNTVLVLTIVAIGAKEEKRGIWWFRDTKHFLQVQLMANLFDPSTGSKLYSEPYQEEIEIDEADADSIIAKTEIAIPALLNTVDNMSRQIGSAVCQTMQEAVWKSLTLSSENGKVMIASGGSVGIKVGDKFEVFDGSRKIEGADGQIFIIPGPKIGEIEVSKVNKDNAEAISISNTLIPGRSIIVPKFFSIIN